MPDVYDSKGRKVASFKSPAEKQEQLEGAVILANAAAEHPEVVGGCLVQAIRLPLMFFLGVFLPASVILEIFGEHFIAPIPIGLLLVWWFIVYKFDRWMAK